LRDKIKTGEYDSRNTYQDTGKNQRWCALTRRELTPLAIIQNRLIKRKEGMWIRNPIVNEVLHRMTKTDTLTKEEMIVLNQIINAEQANKKMMADLSEYYQYLVQTQRKFWFDVHERLGLKQDVITKGDISTGKITWEEEA
jgi:hypothetical protein